VTGTLLEGSVAAGDEVELLPEKLRLRVSRGVQSGGKATERSAAGQRTAVNLAESSTRRQTRHGAGPPGRFRATHRVDVRLELLGSRDH